jgi:hypothetical protein
MAVPGRISAGRAGPAESEMLVAIPAPAQTAAIRRGPLPIGLDVLATRAGILFEPSSGQASAPVIAFCGLRLGRPQGNLGKFK